MTRMLVRFVKGEEMRWVSHLDLLRTLQRALRRGNIPLAFSLGFNPHPLMAFASALGVGVASEREYMDITLTEAMMPDNFINVMRKTLPVGLEMNEAVWLPEGTPALMASMERSRYRIHFLKEPNGVEEAVGRILQSDSLPVQREGKKGMQTLDIRPGIAALAWDNDLVMELSSSSKLNVRPKEVAALICDVPFLVTRLECLVSSGKGMLEWAKTL